MEKKFCSTKRKFINDGVFRAEVNELLQVALAEFGFSGIEVNFTKGKTEVRVLVSQFNKLMNPEAKTGIKINELKGLIEQRFGFNRNPDHKFSLFIKRTFHRGIEAQEQAEYLKKRLLMGTPARSAAMNVIRNMLNKGAKGCEVIISGKLRQGIMGIKVKIMLPTNPAAATGKGFGIPFTLPDIITFKESKNEEEGEQRQYRRRE